ncbi:MAG: hypothetical protein H7287_14475 [Thermoleophilia bacterium]|nr:hypothetical protein [Thermoleophilia bacterium]
MKATAILTTKLGRVLLSAVAVGAVASVGVMTTGATFTDQVTMATVSVTGGTLDLKANGGDGPNQAWAGSLSAAVTGMKPGDEQSGTVQITNSGTLPFTASLTTTGADANACYVSYFRELSATGATKAASFPVNFTGMGTAVGADGTGAAFTAGVTALALPDNGADLIWETDDVKNYTLTVRMKSSCVTNAAAGTLNYTINATQ